MCSLHPGSLFVESSVGRQEKWQALGVSQFVQVTGFCCYDRLSDKNLKEDRFILAHGFRCFSPCSVGIAFRPVVRQNIMVEGHGWEKAAHLTAARRQSEGMGWAGTIYTLQRPTPSDQFFNLGPILY
jgi:hypothetical protein